MELATTNHLQKSQTLPKRYRLFSIDANTGKPSETQVKWEFFYVSNNIDLLNQLLAQFEGGYFAENVDNAKQILKQTAQTNQPAPSVVILDAELGELEVKKMIVQLQLSPVFSKVPVLVYLSEANLLRKASFIHIPLVDDVITAAQINDRLTSKLRLISKAKNRMNHPATVAKQVASAVNETSAGIHFGKRAFDVLVSGVAIFLLSPLFLLIAIAIRLESRGPIFYISKRAGRGYQVFNFFKFRSMFTDADKQVDALLHLNQYDATDGKPTFFKLNNDPRVTKVGAFLRNTSLDELPQLLNVLLGHMSLVGNRPLPLYEAATLTTDEWAARFMAPAGITGLWQIMKRGKADMSVEERIQLDIDYAKHHGFFNDIKIMLKTPAALFQKSNV